MQEALVEGVKVWWDGCGRVDGCGGGKRRIVLSSGSSVIAPMCRFLLCSGFNGSASAPG